MRARKRYQRSSSACSISVKLASGCCKRHSCIPVKISSLRASAVNSDASRSILPPQAMVVREMLRPIHQIRKCQTQDFDGHPKGYTHCWWEVWRVCDPPKTCIFPAVQAASPLAQPEKEESRGG